MLSRKWMLRLALTGLALLVTTDRRRRPAAAPPAPPEPDPKPE
ncbi:hypothetical protein [Hymenobacter canadensis]|uniref:Uncharacterized protein n=1 Tax=Hymenobacter canadensis TaxID=2999067 RepID=A0ABY7LSQ9_9BACT|nr:hypothetical protein [Hymenobacter canadensis]WBA43446.1 hypothetical protein O3303_07725 [Hymenobacter canadensis]